MRDAIIQGSKTGATRPIFITPPRAKGAARAWKAGLPGRPVAPMRSPMTAIRSAKGNTEEIWSGHRPPRKEEQALEGGLSGRLQVATAGSGQLELPRALKAASRP